MCEKSRDVSYVMLRSPDGIGTTKHLGRGFSPPPQMLHFVQNYMSHRLLDFGSLGAWVHLEVGRKEMDG